MAAARMDMGMLEVKVVGDFERFSIEFFFQIGGDRGELGLADGVEREAFLHFAGIDHFDDRNGAHGATWVNHKAHREDAGGDEIAVFGAIAVPLRLDGAAECSVVTAERGIRDIQR